jgi:flagellar basal-body rod protein FlgB
MLANAMDAYSLRNKALASNIANIDTPGYRRLEVSFEEEMGKAIKGTTGKNIDEVHGKVSTTSQKKELEDEMMELADTQIRTQIVTKELRHHFTMLRSAILGRPQG